MAGRIRSIKPGASAAERDRFYRTTSLPRGPVVYFIQAGESGPVKVGFAWDLRTRLCTMQPSNHEELRVIGFIPNGTRTMEGHVHFMFEAERIRGEWFHPAPALLAFARMPR